MIQKKHNLLTNNLLEKIRELETRRKATLSLTEALITKHYSSCNVPVLHTVPGLQLLACPFNGARF